MCWTAQPHVRGKCISQPHLQHPKPLLFPAIFAQLSLASCQMLTTFRLRITLFFLLSFFSPLSEKHGRKKRNQISRQGFGSGFCRKCSSEWHPQLLPCFHVLNLKPMNSVATPTTKHQEYHQCLLQPRSPYYRPFCGLERLLIFSVFPVLGTWIEAV